MNYQAIAADFDCLYHPTSMERYRVFRFKRDDPKAMVHYPPKKKERDASKWVSVARDAWALGYRGVCVSDLGKLQDEQLVELHWACIDIDWPQKMEMSPKELLDRVATALYCRMYEGSVGYSKPAAHIRTSKSGNGLHCFFKFDRPYPFNGVCSAEAAAHAFIMPWVKKLNDAGIETCMRGLPNMWVWSEGGKQHWECWGPAVAMHALAPELQTVQRRAPKELEADAPREGLAGEIAQALSAAGIPVGPHEQINIGEVKRALEKVLPIKTVSSCRPGHEGETNGFLECTPYHIALFSSPDNTGGAGSGWLFKIPRED